MTLSFQRPILLLSAAILAFGIYAPTLAYDLVWDDVPTLDSLHRRVGERGVLSLFAAPFSLDSVEPPGSSFYRPLVHLTLLVDGLAGGRRPALFHLTNVLLHAAVTLLLCLLLSRIFPPAAAWIGTVLFAFHPVHTESVAWVSGRTDLLAAFFILLSVIFWLRDREGRPADPFPNRLLGGISLFLGTLSKEVALLLPFLLLAWDLLLPRADKAGSENWKTRNRPWFLVWGIALASHLVLRWGVAHVVVAAYGEGTTGAELARSPLLMGMVAVKYFQLLIVPWPLNANYYPVSAAFGWVTVSAAALLLILFFLAWSGKSGRAGALALAWTVLFLLPVTLPFPFVPLDFAERFLYIPSIGLCLLGARAAQTAFSRDRAFTARRLTGLFLVALVLIAGWGTLARIPVWRDDVSLNRDILSRSPANHMAHGNLGAALFNRGDVAGALAHLREAVRLAPGFANAWAAMGQVYRSQGSYDEALGGFEKALAADPRSFDALTGAGLSLVAMGRMGEALPFFRRAAELRPSDAAARYHLGLTLLNTGDREEARKKMAALRTLSPALAEQLGQALREADRAAPPSGPTMAR